MADELSVPLREHLEALMSARDHRIRLRFDALAEANAIAAQGIRERFEAVNEFRAQLSDQAVTFVRSDVASSEHAAIGHEIDTLRDQVAALRVELSAMTGERLGSSETLDNQRALFGLAIITLALLVSVAAVVTTIALAHH